MKKRGISGLVIAVLLILISISAVVILSLIVLPILKESEQNTNIKQFSSDIKIPTESIAINRSESSLEFLINKNDKIELSLIRVIVFAENNTKFYNLIEIPESNSYKKYLLNISQITYADKLIIYPIFKNGKEGIGERIELPNINKSVDKSLAIINPVIYNSNCITNFECVTNIKCTINYNLDNLNSETLELKSEQTKICIDKNNCNKEIIERKPCNDDKKVTLVKESENGHNYVKVLDSSSKVISRLELVEGENNKLNLEFPIV